MSNKRPPDFTKNEARLITATLSERFGHDIEIEQANAEIRLNPAIPELTDCPIVFREVDNGHYQITHADKHHFTIASSKPTEPRKNVMTIYSTASSVFSNRRRSMKRKNLNKVLIN